MISGKVVPTQVFCSLSLFIDFICIGCSQSHWLSLDKRCAPSELTIANDDLAP